MAALETEGMITHPHTSAGRIPSHVGYRYYVGSLMAERELSQGEQFTILHQFQQSARELEDWVGLAASVLANSLHNVGLVTEPRVVDVRLKQVQLVELSETRALLIVVTNDAGVHQHILDFPVQVEQETLGDLANRLNGELAGLTAAEIRRVHPVEPLSGVEGRVVAETAELLSRAQDAMRERPIVEGVREMLRQPEFVDADRMLDTLEAVEERHLRGAIPSQDVAPGTVAIVIGDENREGPYQDMSFVLARYGIEGGATGVLGILGPTRLDYGEAVSHVRYVSDVLTELMRKFYGEE
jgi:heat-inducible transcriptional repressor